MGADVSQILQLEFTNCSHTKNDLVKLSTHFQSMSPKVQEQKKYVTQDAFYSWLMKTVPFLTPTSLFLYELFRNPKKCGMCFQEFCELISTVANPDIFSADNNPLTAVVFDKYGSRNKERIPVENVAKITSWLFRSPCSKSNAKQLIKSNNGVNPNQGFTRAEFSAFLLSQIPQVNDVCTETAFIQKVCVAQRPPSTEFKTTVIQAPQTVREKWSYDNTLPDAWWDIVVEIFGEEQTLTFSQYDTLRESLSAPVDSPESFARRIFSHYDSDNDGILSIEDCMRFGADLHLPKESNSRRIWLGVIDECAILYGKSGINIEWFSQNLFFMQ